MRYVAWIRIVVLPLGLFFAWVSILAETSPSPPPQFFDITASTGIRFNHLSAPDKKYIVESMSGGLALIDYDRDGFPDIYFTNAPSVEMALEGKKAKSALYRNNHDGTFTDVTDRAGVGYPCWAMGAVVGDYNNDGWPDLVVTCFGGVVLYRNRGDGSFQDVTEQSGLGRDHAWAMGASLGDYDNDGLVDLFVAHYVDFDLRDLPTFGSKKTCQYHEIAVQCGPRGLAGAPDLLYRNNGDGTFREVSQQTGVNDPNKYFGLTVVWSDFDEDGRLDLFVANDGEPNYLYRNEGNGRFKDVALDAGVAVNQDGTEQANMGIALGDFLHTGRFSILISHFSEEYATLFRNDGKMSFSDISFASGIAAETSSYVGWGDAFADFDNDGWSDLLIVNGHVYPQVDSKEIGTRFREPKLLFQNQRNGSFRNITALAGSALAVPQVSRGLVVGDLFNDGHLDLVIENLDGGPMILQSRDREANHWVSFTLEGKKSNRLALNAKVRITSGDLVQVDEVRSGGSYLSQNDLRLHFGLGQHARIDKVEVIWPSGAKDVLLSLLPDRFYTVREGEGVVTSTQPSTSHERQAAIKTIDRGEDSAMTSGAKQTVQRSRFEFEEDGLLAYLDFDMDSGGWMTLLHTEVPEELRGRGISQMLARTALEYARDHQLKVDVVCPLVAEYLVKNPEFQPLVKS